MRLIHLRNDLDKLRDGIALLHRQEAELRRILTSGSPRPQAARDVAEDEMPAVAVLARRPGWPIRRTAAR